MEFLDAVFDLWLIMLENVVDDSRIGSLFWVFILVMIALILRKIWKGVYAWTGC